MAEAFREGLTSAPKSLRGALERLAHLFFSCRLAEAVPTLLEGNALLPCRGVSAAAQVRRRVRELYPLVRRTAVPIVDGFGFSDFALGSALGRADGRVYEALLAWAKEEPMNTEHSVTPAFEADLKPMFAHSRL